MLEKFTEHITRIKDSAIRWYEYATVGVWSDLRPSPWVRVLKTANLSVRAFFDGDIQTKACALTYRSVLAIVPALALVFAVGRGFGLQNVIEDELIASMPSQERLLRNAFVFVNSYLDQSSEGLFVGIGIALLLWTLVSIVGSVEDAFNSVWGVKQGRSIWRKITDYLAIFLILPVLMICAGGLSAMFTTSLSNMLPMMTPVVKILLDIASFVAIWLFFTAVYMMIPNTKVKLQNAFVSGVFAGTAFIILQWLFITGQVYVSKYNAIYGSFAFLPLFLIWLQLVWVVTLAGAVICYASQNIIRYNFNDQISRISQDYRLKFDLAVLQVVVARYCAGQTAPTEQHLIDEYAMPNRLVSMALDRLIDDGLLLKVVIDQKAETYGYAPAIPPDELTVGEAVKRLSRIGTSNFVPEFGKRFGGLVNLVAKCEDDMIDSLNKTLIKDLSISKYTQTNN